MPIKFILLGKGGRLANFILRERPEAISYSKEELDITDKHRLLMEFSKVKPKFIINCAAITDLEYCESHSAECFEVNAHAVKSIVEAAESVNAKLIHFSSNYAEYPVNAYARSKLESESYAKNHLVIRSAMFDKSNFAVNKLLFSDETINAYDNMYFNPIYMGTISKFIFENLSHDGIINVGVKECISLYDFALAICKIFKINDSRVKASRFENVAGKASRPMNSCISSKYNYSLKNELMKLKSDLS